MNTIEDQALKLHDFMLKHQHKDVPLHACIKALKKYDKYVNEACDPHDDIMCKAGLMYRLAVEELLNFKLKLDS